MYADLESYYKSVYTHSIPWAMHGKAHAKANRRADSLLGNSLDLLTQRMQDQQTMGLPTGPDTSLIISELLLAPLHRSESGLVPSVRFMDDVLYCCDTLGEAETLLARLGAWFAEFELHLSPQKTRIVELPDPIELDVSQEVSALIPQSGSRSFSVRMQRLFDSVARVHRRYPGKGVFQYVLGAIQRRSLRDAEWSAVEAFVLSAIVAEPSSLERSSRILIERGSSGLELSRERVEAALNLAARLAAERGHSYEAAWAIWGLVQLRLSVLEPVAQEIARQGDVVAAIALRWAIESGVVIGSSELSWKLDAEVPSDALKGQAWLYYFECVARDWPAARDVMAHEVANDWARLLIESGVDFLRSDAAADPLRSEAGEEY